MLRHFSPPSSVAATADFPDPTARDQEALDKCQDARSKRPPRNLIALAVGYPDEEIRTIVDVNEPGEAAAGEHANIFVFSPSHFAALAMREYGRPGHRP